MEVVIRCKKCGSTQVYFRTKTNDYHCTKCGSDCKREECEE